MRTISYTAKERRAANQVWNAAERYNFDPALYLVIGTEISVRLCWMI